MSGQVINYQGNIFILNVLASAIHCPAFYCGPYFAGGDSKTPLRSPRIFPRLHQSLSVSSLLFFLMVINFIFNHFHLEYIELY